MLPLVGDRLAFRPSSGVPVLCFGELEGQTAFVHGILTRQGGVSRPPYDSLNVSLSVGDDPDHVAANRRRAQSAIGRDNLRPVRCRQVSGTAVAVVSDPPPSEPVEADALVTRSAGLVLWMTFADCLPIILADPTVPALALVHAGWRGTVGAIAVKAWKAMRDLGAKAQSTTAYLGPAICQNCYEVGEDVASLARRLGPAGEGKREGHLDTAGLRRQPAPRPKVRAVHSGVCTACRTDLFSTMR